MLQSCQGQECLIQQVCKACVTTVMADASRLPLHVQWLISMKCIQMLADSGGRQEAVASCQESALGRQADRSQQQSACLVEL